MILMKFRFSSQIFEKYADIKFNENALSGNRVRLYTEEYVAFVKELCIFEISVPGFLHSMRVISGFILFAAAYKNLYCFMWLLMSRG
jgi:hypothetical protein